MVTDPIRIVPLRPAPGIAPAVSPQLTYRGGPLLSAVEVFTAFWGADWQGADAPLMAQVNDFFRYVVTSTLMDQLGEYSVPPVAIGHGSLTGTTTITDTQPTNPVTDAQIRSLIQSAIANATVPATTPNSLYFIYLPPGVDVDLGGQRSCSAFCGYHDSIGGSVYYAVMPYPGCSGCVGGLSTLDALTSTSSHELCEAITDPIPGSGWYDDVNGEIGDICAWTTTTLGPYTVQREWSNSAGKCV